MSTVKIEPFFFGSEEDSIQLNPEQLPGAVQPTQEDSSKEKTEAKPKATETEETQKPVAVEQKPTQVDDDEDEEEDDDQPDSYGFFNKDGKEKRSKKQDEEENSLTNTNLCGTDEQPKTAGEKAFFL